tara:strand:- start:269 stop:1261 length:993 start_codon:yes stop_codon:yes gene_type:complete
MDTPLNELLDQWAEKKAEKTGRPKNKPSTMKQYEGHIIKLQKAFDTTGYGFIERPDDIVKLVKGKASTTQRNVFTAVYILTSALNHDGKYDDLLEKYDRLKIDLQREYEELQKTNVISEKQAQNFAQVDEIQEMLKKMEDELKTRKVKDGVENDSQLQNTLTCHLIYSILQKYPFRNDLAGMKIITKTAFNKLDDEERKSNNYMINQKGKLTFVLNDYKTNRTYGEKKFDIDKETEKVIRRYLKILNKKSGDVLLTSSTDFPISRNYMSQMLMKCSKRYMGKSVSTTMVRKAVASDKFVDKNEEQKELADIMAHDVGTQNKVYVKKTRSV